MLKLRFFCRKHLIILIGIGIIFVSVLIKALPQGGSVVSGDVTITGGNNLAVIKQQTQKGIINWQSFNIGAAEKTQFIQPGASSVTLNRITGGNASSILGQLIANGQIFLINPAGIIFGANSRVDVAGLLASTANISNADFLAGNYQFMQGPGNASIINQGYIKAANNGFVYLVAPRVDNSGLIEANLGKVVLGSAPSSSIYTLDFYGDKLIQFALSPDAGSDVDSAITQSGKIVANGGVVMLTTPMVKSVVNSAINMSGIIEANTISNKGGKIILSGGEQGVVSVTGKIIARGDKAGEKGGKVKITGQNVGLFQNAKIDVSGMAGGGEVLIGAKYFGNNVVPAAQAVYVGPNANIFANAITSGNGGKIIILSDDSTRFYGTAQARGGAESGIGGFVETSSKNWLDISGAHVDVSAPKGNFGTWLLDPYDVYISNTPPSANGTWSNGTTNIWSPGGNESQLYVGDILSNLASADIEIETGGVGSPGNQTGNILWQVGADLTYAGVDERTLSLIAANNIEIDAAINGANLNLVLEAGGSATLNSAIGAAPGGALSSLTVSSGISTNINTANITTIGNQSYTGNVALGNANTTMFTTTNATIEFAGKITGVNQSVDISSGTGNVGLQAVSNVGALQLLGSGDKTLGGIISNTASLNIAAGGTTFINAPSITTTGNQAYGNAVSLLADTALAGNNISFVNTINGGFGLGITAAGSTTFGDGIGTTPGEALSSLAVSSGTSTNINTANITTTGTQSYTGAVVLGGASPTTFSTTNNAIIFLGGITGTGQNINLSSGTGNVGLQGVNNVGALRLLGSGDKTLGGVISNTASLNVAAGGTTFISIPSITTTGNQTYGNAVSLLANTALAGNNIIFANTINGGFGLGITAAGSTTFGGGVGTTPGEALSSLAVSSGTSTNINTANITTTGTQSYTGAVVLGGASPTTFSTTNNAIIFLGGITGTGQNIDLSSGTGNVGLQGVNNVGALQLLGSGNKTLGGIISNTASLNIVAGGTTFINAPSITTTGNQAYGNVVSLLANTALVGNNISFVNTINGGFGLGITAAGSAIFSGAVGITNALSYLTVTAGAINISGGAIKTNLSQTYNNPVVLGANTILTTTDAAGNIVFVSTVDSDGTLRTLELNTKGNITLNAAVGGISPLSSLLIDTSVGTTYLKGGAVNTSGNQTYGENVILGEDTTFSASNITFAKTLNSDTTPRLPTFNILGNITFGGAVGGVNALSSLTTGTTGIMYINGGWVNTIGLQYYQEPVILGANTLLTGSAIGFTSTINSLNSISPSSLTLNTPGNVVFAGMIGGNKPLQNLTVGGGGILYFFGDGATTTGFQTYNDAIDLRQNVFLVAGNGITFNSTITGPHNLSLDTGSSSNILFNGAVGAYADSIGLLYIKNAHDVTANAGVYVTAFEQNAGSGVTLFNNTLYVGMGSAFGFVHGTGPAVIRTNSVVGNIDIGTLYLGTSSASLTGYVGGVSGVPAAKVINLLNQIAPGTSYYDTIDLYGLVPINILNDSLMQSILESLYGSLNFGFGYEFLDMGDSKFDYLFLLEPPQCG